MKRVFCVSVAALALVSMSHSSANAALVTFDFGPADNGLATIVKTVGGVTLTLSNPQPEPFVTDADGLAVLSTGAFSNIDTFDMVFSAQVILTSYSLGFLQLLDGNETMTFTDGISTSIEAFPFATGTRNFANQFTVAAGQTIMVTAGGNEFPNLLQLGQLTVDTVPIAAVPEPSSIAV